MGVTDLLLLSCLGFAITAHAQNCSVPDGGPTMHLKDEYILKQTFASGDQAAFTCASGYHPEGGSPSITCTAGSWSTVRLKCERNSCGSPGELEKGQIHYPKENLFGDHIEITCNAGYKLVGKSQITCGAQGWLDRLPRCEAVTCNPPPLVSNPTFTPHKDSYNFEDVVRYSCGGGLTLNGSASISCSNNGTFQPAPPTCIKVECKDLDILHADWISGSRPPHGHKATVEYKCRKGFKMVGQSTLICEINSQWSPEPPRCDVVTCKSPPMLAKGIFSPVKEVYKYRDVVEYSCQIGFKLSGSESASCSDDGTFEPDPPTCIKITEKPGVYCEDPHVEHGHLTNDAWPPYRPNDKVTFECSSFYKMEGEPTLTCQADFNWSPPPPECTLSIGKVVGTVIGIAAAAAGAGGYGYHRSQNSRKRLGDGNATKPEEEAALSEGVSLKECPTGNGQESGGTVDKSPVMSKDNV